MLSVKLKKKPSSLSFFFTITSDIKQNKKFNFSYPVRFSVKNLCQHTSDCFTRAGLRKAMKTAECEMNDHCTRHIERVNTNTSCLQELFVCFSTYTTIESTEPVVLCLALH